MSNSRFRCAQCKHYAEQNTLFRQAGLARLCSTKCYSDWLDAQRKKRHRATKKAAAKAVKVKRATAHRIPGELRFAVRERDQGLCRWCGKTGTQLHHIRYLSEGGPDEPSNLILLCGRCHERAHSSKSAFQPVLLRYTQIVEAGGPRLFIPDIARMLKAAGELSELQLERFFPAAA